MIGKVTGIVAHRAHDHVLVETPGGVGYVVLCSERTLARVPAEGGPVSLFTELVVREDLWQLFGFVTLAEREWHRLLTSVQGVGAKAALAILGTLGPEGTGRAITLGDAGAIRATPGIGPKIAARVVNELKDKAPRVMALGAGGAREAMPGAKPAPRGTSDAEMVDETPAPTVAATNAPAPSTGSAQAQSEALSALVNLGYGHGDAATAVAQSIDDGAVGTPELIRAALRRLAPEG